MHSSSQKWSSWGARALLPSFAFDFLAAYILKEETSAFILLTHSWEEYFIGLPLRNWTRASAFLLILILERAKGQATFI